MFLASYIPLAVIAYLLLDQTLALTVIAIMFVCWSVVYIYFDKVVLMLLRAREIINTDEQALFQTLKNKAYKFHESTPKVYLYNSELENFFIFESRGSWCIVLSRKLLDYLSSEQTSALIEFAFRYKKTNMTKLKTKCLGLSILYQIIIHKLSTYLFTLSLVVLILFSTSFISLEHFWATFLAKVFVGFFIWGLFYFMRKVWMSFFQFSQDEDFQKALYKSFFIFLTFLTKPFMIPVEICLKWSVKTKADPSLESFYLTAKEKNEQKDRVITNVFISDRSFEKNVTDYIESFPLLLECEFGNEY